MHYPSVLTLADVAEHTTAKAIEAPHLHAAVGDLAAARRIGILLDIVAMGGAAGDVLDVYVDVLAPDGATWLNAVHFPQIAGNGAAAKHFAVLDPSSPGNKTIAATSDASAGDVRPALFGSALRVRHTLVDAGAHGQKAKYGVTAIVQ
jgi:hypothetical protein